MASVADALAALHASGRAHGAVDSAHVELGADGTGVLRPALARDDRGPSSPPADVAGLGALLGHLVGSCGDAAAGTPLARLANLARLATAEDVTARPTAAALAALLRASSAPTVLPGLEPSPRRPAPRRRGDGPPGWRLSGWRLSGWWHRVAAGAAAVAVAGACLAALVPHGHPAPARARVPVPQATGPIPVAASASRVWPAITFRDGVLTSGAGRFTVGAPDDVVVAGDWGCSGTATPALLRPSTGEVFVFPSWPGTGQHVTGRLVGTVAGAIGLRPTGRSNKRCAGLSALASDGTVVPVDTGGQR